MVEMFLWGQILSALVLSLALAGYLWAWRRVRATHKEFAGRARLFSFGLGIGLLMLALVWPVPEWTPVLLTGRSVQKALVAMLAPPLLWLGLPFHVVARSLTPATRRRFRWAGVLRRVTHPLAAWLGFVSVFLLWHDPTYVNGSVNLPGVQLAAAWLLLLVALVFWWHVVNTGPRLHARLPGWLMALFLLGVEIPNMAAGVTIAFTMHPVYPAYAALHMPGSDLPIPYPIDQMVSGAIIWVFGSMVYISAIIGVLYRLFRLEGSNAPRPLLGWDDARKTIAPGLEHRVEHEEPTVPWQRTVPLPLSTTPGTQRSQGIQGSANNRL